jgi:hypothetical protein
MKINTTVKSDNSYRVDYTTKRSNVSSFNIGQIYKNKNQSYNFRNLGMASSQFAEPEYNLYEISNAIDGDGLPSQTFEKKNGLMFKNGWMLTGKNEKTIAYLRNRFLELSIAQNIPMELLLKQSGWDFVSYSNVFLFKKRNRYNSSGRPRKVKTSHGEVMYDPISAYFRLAPETMQVLTDEYGNIKKYKQKMPDGREREFLPRDIVHLTFNKRAGFNFARPSIWPGIEDIRSLRRLEEYVELLVQNYIFPIPIVYVGTDELPVTPNIEGSSEIDVWTQKFEDIDINEGIVLPHRVKVDTLGFKTTIPAEDYLEYFKKRVLTSLGISATDIGEVDSSNKSTADNASKHLIDNVKNYQLEFSIQIKYFIINELLLENYDNSVLNDDNCVYFNFNEIDIDALIKWENHNAMIYVMNTITEDEFRYRIKEQPIQESERNKLYLETYEIPKASKVAKLTENAKGAKAQTSSQVKPRNQHSKDFLLIRSILDDFRSYDYDFLQSKLINTLFLLDKPEQDVDFCIRGISIISEIVEFLYNEVDTEKYPEETRIDMAYESLRQLLSE